MISIFAEAIKGIFRRSRVPLTLSVITFSSAVFGHGGESRVEIELERAGAINAGASAIEFQLVDTEANKVITDSDLNVSHEKLLHVLFYDPALKEFRHVHPEFQNNLWRVEIDPSVNGNYFFWAQGVLRSDSTEFSSFVRIEVINGNSAWPTPPQLRDIRISAEGASVATLENKRIRAGRSTMLNLTFTRNDGSTPVITPYLGAFAHVIIVAEDGDTLVHAHPMNGSKPNEGMLHATFPRVGHYRLWIQFIDGGNLKTIPLEVEVF